MSSTIEDRLALLEVQVFELQNASGWVEDTTPQQGLRHAAFRAISGTAGTFAGDQMAAMKTELEAHAITVPPDFDGRLIAWLQLRLDSSNSDLNELLVEWARAEGVDDAGVIGSFDPTPPTIVAVATSADDASEVVSSGVVSISGTTIGLQDDRIAGFRFDGVEIPQGATIASAWIQFTSAITIVSGGTAAAVVDIHGEDADDAAAFTTAAAGISARTQTTATVEWSLPESSGASAWTTGYRGTNQRTPDLATIVQEIVDRAGWASGNAMAFTLQHDGVGLGSRSVVAQDHAGYKEAVLYVDWTETAGVVQDGLVAEWRFDQGAGQVLTDYAGGHHGHLGTTAGSDTKDPTWTAQGLSFDGSNDYVSTTDWEFPSPQFHVDIVGYFASTGGGTDFVVAFGTTRTGAGDDDTSPLIVFREGATASVRMRMGNGATNVLSSPGGTVFDDAWHHLSIDYDGSQLTVEVDGTVAISQNLGLTPNVITASTLFGIWHNLALLPATMTLGYVTAYEGAFSSAQKAQQAAALAAIMAARGITLP